MNIKPAPYSYFLYINAYVIMDLPFEQTYLSREELELDLTYLAKIGGYNILFKDLILLYTLVFLNGK